MPDPSSPDQPESPSFTPWGPDRLIDERFQIVRELGRGGMGAVYVVFDREVCRELALKRIHPEFAGQVDCEERFRREYRALASIRDPGVPQVYHSGRSADGVAWFTMEVVRGESLRAILDRGLLPSDRALGVALALGKILVAAHEAGVIHRDVKPGNVMVEPGDRVRLLDFGVCTPLPRFLRAAEPRRRTADVDRWESGEARFAGTLGYSDPNTLDGSAPTIRSDIFSLGAILYELLTGRRLFDPEACAYRTIDSAELPLALAPLAVDVRRATAINPFERPRSMAEFVQRLEIARGHLLRADHETRVRQALPAPWARQVLPWMVGLTLGLGVAVAARGCDRFTAPAASPDPGTPAPATDDSRLASGPTAPARPVASLDARPVHATPDTTSPEAVSPGIASPDAASPGTASPEAASPGTGTAPASPGTGTASPGAGAPPEPPASPVTALASPSDSPRPASSDPSASPRARSRRLLARRHAAVARCVATTGSFQRRLVVHLDLGRGGSPRAVRLASGEHSGLSRCVAAALSDMSFPPGTPTPLTHTFELDRP